MTTYLVNTSAAAPAAPAAAPDTFMLATGKEGENYSLARVKGNAVDKARNALKQGADFGAMVAHAPTAARKSLVQAIGAQSTATLGQQVAHADYRRAIASVAGVANHSFTMWLDGGKGPARSDWQRLGAELRSVQAMRTPKGNPTPAAKMAERGAALWAAIQGHADELRAAMEAARKAAAPAPAPALAAPETPAPAPETPAPAPETPAQS